MYATLAILMCHIFAGAACARSWFGFEHVYFLVRASFLGGDADCCGGIHSFCFFPSLELSHFEGSSMCRRT